MNQTKKASDDKTVYLAIPANDGRHSFVFMSNDQSMTKKGLPTYITSKLVGHDGDISVVVGESILVPNNWEPAQLHEKMLRVLKLASAEAFFKTVARKPELWSAWEHGDYEALRIGAARYVYMEEIIARFYTDVLGKSYVRRTPADGVSFQRQIRSTRALRGNHKNYSLHVKRELWLFYLWDNGGTMDKVRVTYTFSAPTLLANPARNDARLSLTFDYPVAEWPSLKEFLAEPRVQVMLDTWIENAWNDKQRDVARTDNKVPPLTAQQ